MIDTTVNKHNRETSDSRDFSKKESKPSVEEHNRQTRDTSDSVREHNKQTREAPHKKSFKEKVRDRFSRVKSVITDKINSRKNNSLKPSSSKSSKSTSSSNTGRKGKKNKGERLNTGAKYTSLFGSRLQEDAVPGFFVDPFAGEREVRGHSGKSPFVLSMGSPPPPDMGYGRLPSPGELMGMGKRKRR